MGESVVRYNANKLSSTELYNKLVSTSPPIVIDARCQICYNEDHIVNSEQLVTPKHGPRQHLVVPWLNDEQQQQPPQQQQQQSQVVPSTVIVYGSINDKESLSKALDCVRNSLPLGRSPATWSRSIFELEGGIEAFERLYPFMCSKDKAFLPSSSSSSSSGSSYSKLLYHFPSEIESWLFLGGFLSREEGVLKRMNIKLVINLDDLFGNTSLGGVTWTNFHVKDEVSFNIEQYFDEAFDLIEEQRLQHGRVLVSCAMGISRSPTIVIAYLMRYKHWSASQALDFVKSKRSQILPNVGFLQQLRSYERSLGIHPM